MEGKILVHPNAMVIIIRCFGTFLGTLGLNYSIDFLAYVKYQRYVTFAGRRLRVLSFIQVGESKVFK